MYASNPYSTYKQNSINMASKEQLLLMLVDGAVKYTKVARIAIEKKDISVAHKELTRVQDIFTELMATLNMDGGSFTKDLYNIYEYIKHQLGQANIKKDITIIDETLPLIEEIRDMWHEANRLRLQK
ncbi:MAG: flagellar export chaperone FliS [Peptostreptococcaceae bacterium]